MRSALTCALLSLCMGCAAFRERPVDPGLFLLPPHAAGREASLTQSVRVTSAKGASFETLAAVEVERGALRVAALGPLGNRILFLEWDGEEYREEKDPHFPSDFPVKVVLRDLELCLFPAESVRRALPSEEWSLIEKPRARELHFEGKPVVAIAYSSDDRWNSTIHFEHLTLGYRLEVRAVDLD